MGWSPLFPTRFLVSRGTLDPARRFTISPTGLSPSLVGFPKTILLSYCSLIAVLTPKCTHLGLGSFHFARRYFGNRLFSFSSSGYLDVSVHRVPLHTLWIHVWIHGVCPCGFPHSDIRGSRDICSSPTLIAAYHVFHRLLVPRHPPCALYSLTILQDLVLFSLNSISLAKFFQNFGHGLHISFDI